MSLESRLIEMETKLAWQERLIAELNEALADQQRQIDRLEQALREARAQLRAALDAGIARPGEDAPPPHY
ncbi:MAG: SlyX family protein [Mariprofundaceae bacterium]